MPGNYDDDLGNDYESYDDDYEEDYSYRSREDRRNERIELLEQRIAADKAKAVHEAVLREMYPALQDAWEKYQIVLRTIS